MLTRLQEDRVSDLTSKHGRVAVDEGFEDGAAVVTAPNGESWLMDCWGDLTRQATGLNFSVQWDSEIPTRSVQYRGRPTVGKL